MILPNRCLLGLLVLLTLLLLQNCNTKKREKKEKLSTKPATINKIHFFLETSASMGGYLKGSTEFKDVISEVVTKSNTIRPVTIWTISDKPQAFSGDVNRFVTSLATTPLAMGKSSKLHSIFNQVAQKVQGNDIAVLVSDCILSFPDEDVKRNREINRTDASSVLKNAIYDQFVKLNRQGVNATVYAYTSLFRGTYYTYQNEKQVVTDEKRPFYLWVIGKQSLLREFNPQLQQLLTIKPAQQLDFGAVNEVKEFEVLFSLNKKGEWRPEERKITEIKLGKHKSTEFALGLNLSRLPVYAQSEDYLRKNMKVVTTNAAVKLVNVQRKETLTDLSRLREREQKIINDNTHVITFRVDNLYDEQAILTLKLPIQFDTSWYEMQWSTMDDRTMAGRRDKTFALAYLMNGVKEAYQSSTNYFFNVTIPLTKN